MLIVSASLLISGKNTKKISKLELLTKVLHSNNNQMNERIT